MVDRRISMGIVGLIRVSMACRYRPKSNTKSTDQGVNKKRLVENGNQCHERYALSDMKMSQNPKVLENERADDDADNPHERASVW